jgi:hypothetical protein
VCKWITGGEANRQLRGFILSKTKGLKKMTTNVVRSWRSTIAHISDYTEDRRVLTRCGRTLKDFQVGYPGETECRKCGNETDFDKVYEDNSRRKRIEAEERRVERKKRAIKQEERLAAHRELMSEFEDLLKGWGVKNEEISLKEFPAGGRIEFKVNGFEFKLSGGAF